MQNMAQLEAAKKLLIVAIYYLNAKAKNTAPKISLKLIM
jgi:hypothetical protein